MTDPVTGMVTVAVLSLGYLAALVRLRSRGRSWPVARTVVYFMGVGAVLELMCGWVAARAADLLWVNAVQLLGLLAVAPLLLALGSPASLLSAAAPVRVGRPLRRLLDLPLFRPLTYPVIGALVIAAVPLAMYFTPLATGLARDPVGRQVFALLLLTLGLLAAYPLGEGDLKSASFSYPLAMFAAFVELLIDSGPGILLRYRSTLIEGGFWAPLSRAAGFDALNDQHRAGDVIWLVGEVWDLPVLAVLFVAWTRADRREAADLDASLDAASHPPTGPTAAGKRARWGRAGPEVIIDEEGMIRPWWVAAPPVPPPEFPRAAEDLDRAGGEEVRRRK